MAIAREPVTVVGAGIFGLATAHAAAGRGRRVTVLEAGRIGAGASGGVVGALSPHVPERWNDKKAFQLRALLGAEAFWREVAGASGRNPGYGRIGRLVPVPSAAARTLAEARAAGARAIWGDAAEWCVEDVADAGWLAPAAMPHGVIRETLSARLFPRDALAALAAACRARGVEIVEGAPVSDPEGLPGQVVVAAGVAGFALVGAAGAGVKGQAALVRPRAVEAAPMIYADGLYVVPQASGLVAVGSTSENVFADPLATDDALDRLVARAGGLCPALEGAEVVERWAGLRPKAPARDPMVGQVPGRDRLYAALGGFKIGFGIAHEVGRALAAMLDGEAWDLPDSFSPALHMEA